MARQGRNGAGQHEAACCASPLVSVTGSEREGAQIFRSVEGAGIWVP